MMTRPRFACCACERTFGQLVDLEDNPVLWVECPYCGAECKVDLAPYRERVVTLTRGGESDAGVARYALPDTLPTARLEDDEPRGER